MKIVDAKLGSNFFFSHDWLHSLPLKYSLWFWVKKRKNWEKYTRYGFFTDVSKYSTIRLCDMVDKYETTKWMNDKPWTMLSIEYTGTGRDVMESLFLFMKKFLFSSVKCVRVAQVVRVLLFLHRLFLWLVLCFFLFRSIVKRLTCERFSCRSFSTAKLIYENKWSIN